MVATPSQVRVYSEAMVQVAMIRLMLARLARLTKKQPPLLMLRGEACAISVAA